MSKKEKVCPNCNEKHIKRGKFCCGKCYHSFPKSEETKIKQSLSLKGKPKSQHMRDALSKATKGKLKPHLNGENNPNYNGKCIKRKDIYEKFRKAVSERGQAWNDSDRENHRQKMLGNSNAMRGKKHLPETVEKISKIKKKQYEDGYVKINLNKISKPEKEIAFYLSLNNTDYIQQFHIQNVPYYYDFLIKNTNVIIEFQGNYWHANPNIYDNGTYLRIFKLGDVLVDDIWKKDFLKRKAAEDNGYEIIYIWEDDYTEFGLDLIGDVLTYINK